MLPSAFQQILRKTDVSQIVRDHIVTPASGPHISDPELRHIESVIRTKFQLSADQRVSAIVVGSAKLGFSFLEVRKNGQYKPAYRSYKPGISDIDIAIVSPVVYGKIWSDLASIGAHASRFPVSSKLGDYMYHGWLRPDHFPSPKAQRCIDWDDAYREIQQYPTLRNKRIRLALYHSQHFLETYQQRGLRLALEQEKFV
ncbi:hypothetical protein [Herbaspirillum sp.]|uniref:hypothetical protein n=1 Tax=Herbaspirillum sp. TaxID=1890675 RepID=UPI00257A01FD|nr:hypothetical protein [Herbaspirillum sp.]|tara:strand:- start:12141 stop:12737 length:597 start_codon:yes stop_codon:yes gene_type:complete